MQKNWLRKGVVCGIIIIFLVVGVQTSICDKSVKADPGDIILSFNSPGSNPEGLTWVDGYLWNVDTSNHKIYKLNPSNGSVIDSIDAPGACPGGLTWDGSNFWIADWNLSKIYKVDKSNGAVLATFNSPGPVPMDLAWDGHYLWNSDVTSMIYQLDSSNLNIIKSFVSPGFGTIGLAWDGTFLWNADHGDPPTGNKIYKLNPQDGSVIDSFSSPGDRPWGLAWDGVYLWNADNIEQRIYKINVTGSNLPPVANAGGPYIGYVNDILYFDGENSSDFDGVIIAYRWDWTNDGIWDSDWSDSPKSHFSYSSEGDFSIKLQVKDNENAVDTDVAMVSISNSTDSPVVTIISPIDQAEVFYVVEITGVASDPNGNETLELVEVRIDDSSWISATGTNFWNVSWNTTQFSDGVHEIFARSFDGIYYSSLNMIEVVVNNSLLIFGYCPIDLHVIDPVGRCVNKSVVEIPDTWYQEYDVNGDGDMDDVVCISSADLGLYEVFVIPEVNATTEDLYSLFAMYGDQVMCLEKNWSVLDAPLYPYVFHPLNGIVGNVMIDKISGGFGVRTVIRNNGTAAATNVSWSIDVSGGWIILSGSNTEDIIGELAVGASTTVKSKGLWGIGPITITVQAGDVTKEASAFLLGPLVLRVQEL